MESYLGLEDCRALISGRSLSVNQLHHHALSDKLGASLVHAVDTRHLPV